MKQTYEHTILKAYLKKHMKPVQKGGKYLTKRRLKDFVT